MSRWVNVDEHNGVPSQVRSDVAATTSWRMDAIAAVGRPHDMVLSPSGTEVAFVLDNDDASDIWAMSVDGTGQRRLTTDRGPYAYWEDTPPAWSPDGRLLVYTAEGWVYVVASGGGVPRKVIEGGAPCWLDDHRILITVHRDNISRLAIAELADPWPAVITPRDGSASGVAISPDRSRVAYIHSPADDRRRTDMRTSALDGADVATVVSTPEFFVSGPAFSPDGRSIVFASERSGWSELHVLEGENERQLTHDRAGFSSAKWSADGSSIVAVRTREGVSDLVAVNPISGDVVLMAAGGMWSDPYWLADGSVIAIYEDHRTPPQIMSVNPDVQSVSQFQRIPAAIAVAPHVSPERVTYQSLDGLEIPGFLFKPSAAAGPCPVVVYPHGGPTSHYGDEWDGYAQYFLEKGYGWFAINFRGSTSYGLDFEHANHGVWGVADTDDCLAAHDYLAGLDWVDGDRIAIFGASYGSYMAVAALARDPQHRFACGVAKYGDCDILTSWAQGDQVGVEDLERMMGHPSSSRIAYREGSPIHRVSAIERPLLIAHGELDARVSPKQSQELVDALRIHGKDFEYVTYPTEGHGLLRKGPQTHFYQRLERFLDWHLI